MLRPVAASALLLLFAAPAHGAPEPAGQYVKRLYRLQVGQQFGKVWDTLHPAQQRLVPRKRYAQCETRRRIGYRLELKKIAVLSTETGRFHLEGTSLRVAATTVRIRIDVLVNDFLNRETIDIHVVAVHGKWRWAMERDTALAYKAGRCPS